MLNIIKINLFNLDTVAKVVGKCVVLSLTLDLCSRKSEFEKIKENLPF